VLYCHRENRWKLADFGISAEATSRMAHTTKYSRGTSSYRAPELLTEQATFSNKVDIWALGCVLHEILTDKVAFHEDWAVREYFCKESPLSIPLPLWPVFLQHHLSKNISDLLHKGWKERPSASDVCSIFRGYCTLLDLPCVQMLLDLPNFPSYRELKERFVQSHSTHKELISKADLYQRKGEQQVTIATLWEDLTHETRDLNLDGLDVRGSGSPPKDGNTATQLAAIQNAIEEHPMKLSLWLDLCRLYIATKGFDAAITACNEANSKFPANPVPVFALSQVYAAKGDFKSAIMSYMELLDGRKESCLWEKVSFGRADDYQTMVESERSELYHL